MVSASQVRDAVEAGFHPYVSGIELPPPWDTAGPAVREEHRRRWMRVVEADVSDWDLCRACYTVFRRFNAEQPSPLEVREALPPPPAARTDAPSTILDKVISLGAYRMAAGKEVIGHYDPNVAPFYICAAELPGQGPRIALDQELAARLIERLQLQDPNDLVECFDTVRRNPEVRQVIFTTTLEPFIERYSIGKPRGITEVMMQLELNALSRLLLADPAFQTVDSPDRFLRAAVLFARR